MNSELRSIFISDQQDREDYSPEVDIRDRERKAQVLAMIEKRLLKEPEDFYHAAMVFQHGETTDDYQQANELARKSMDMGYEPAKWLFAASYDRWLVSQGLPQKYGTQFRYGENGEVIYLPIDPSTTDEERLALNVTKVHRPE